MVRRMWFRSRPRLAVLLPLAAAVLWGPLFDARPASARADSTQIFICDLAPTRAAGLSAFRLEPGLDSPCTDPGEICFHGRRIADRDTTLDREWLRRLGAALLDSASYDSTRGARDCAFTPELGIQIPDEAWGSPVDVLLSFHGEQVWVWGPAQGFDFFGDFTGHRQVFLALARQAFPFDTLLAALPDAEPDVAWVRPDSLARHVSPWKLTPNRVSRQEFPFPPSPGPAPEYENDRPPTLLKKVEPRFPATASDPDAAAPLVLNVLVSRSGAVDKVEYVSGPTSLLAAGAAAVRQWTFRPALAPGKPVAVWVAIPLIYNGP